MLCLSHITDLMQDVSSTRNALRLAQQAEETGRDTLARLGAQGERIHNTERNLDLASSQNRIAEEKARELKTLNKSMFAMHVSNPFTSASRREERDRKVMETHRAEREQRDATRKGRCS
jgi:protein transport protein SEC9